MISFLTNQLAVFSRAVKHLWFSEGFPLLSFGLLGVFELVFSRVEVKFILCSSRFVEITAKKLIEFVEEQENPNTKRKTAYDVELCEGS